MLLKPPLEPATLALWFSPALLLAAGGLGVVLYLRRRPRQPPPLSEDEARQLARILRETDS